MALLKYKRMFLLSVLLAAFSIFFLPQTEYGFGWPIPWLEVHGNKTMITGSELLQVMNVKNTFFDLWNLLLGSLIIYGMLFIAYKGLNKLNKDTEIGEK
ncbi:MAG TPA: hypothetical protein VFX34_04245 [Sporosarcina sp.]|nr:hypothetical protein [Sporosarcina sp.]